MKHRRILTAYGESKPLSEWLKDPRCQAKRDAIKWRLKAGWTHERAIGTPTRDVTPYLPSQERIAELCRALRA